NRCSNGAGLPRDLAGTGGRSGSAAEPDRGGRRSQTADRAARGDGVDQPPVKWFLCQRLTILWSAGEMEKKRFAPASSLQFMKVSQLAWGGCAETFIRFVLALVQGCEPLADESLQDCLSGFDLSHVVKQG